MHWSVISAVNDLQVLNRCLLRSPDLRLASEVILQTGHDSAADAYNSAIRNAKAEILVFVHQDVYLPEGWIRAVQRAMDILAHHDPDWAVLGVWGVTNDGEYAGHVYWQGVAGEQFEGGIDVATLDEVVLIVRRASGLTFDPLLRGFHMYGADICLQAKQRGMRSYAISAFCIHNAYGYAMFPLAFWKAYFFMRSKWKSWLPIKTTCIEITPWCWPMIKWNIIRTVELALGRRMMIPRIPDPARFHQELLYHQIINPVS